MSVWGLDQIIAGVAKAAWMTWGAFAEQIIAIC